MMIPRQLRPAGERVPLRGISPRSAGHKASSAAANLQFPGYLAHWYGSGTAALAAALKLAANRATTTRPEVVMPAYACPDVVSAAVFAGVQPVLADTLPELPWLDPVSVERSITRHTVALLSIRFLGLPSNDQALRRMLGSDGPLLIEDHAHAFPLDMQVRSSADLVVISFGRGKPVSLRRGGVLLQTLGSTAANALPPQPADRSETGVRRLMHRANCLLYNLSIQPAVYRFLTRVARVPVDAISYRELTELEPFPRRLHRLLPQAIDRHRSTGRWREDTIESILRGPDVPWVDVATHSMRMAAADCSTATRTDRLWRYPLLLRSETERDRLFASLWQQGLGPSRMYRRLLSEIPATATYVRSGAHPAAGDFARRLLTLPLHSDVGERDLLAMRNCVDQFSEVVDQTGRTALHRSHKSARVAD